MDKRIMKTRKGLKDALLCLLEEHPFEEITVTEICEHARTGRLTFYKYYSDKNELMRDGKRGRISGEDCRRFPMFQERVFHQDRTVFCAGWRPTRML